MKKLMPILERSAIVAYVPWSLFAPNDEVWAQQNHQQSLARLRERSGLGICELVAILDGRPWRHMPLSDVDQGEFATRPHRDHACQACGFVWRPALVNTVGVQFLPGYKDAP